MQNVYFHKKQYSDLIIKYHRRVKHVVKILKVAVYQLNDRVLMSVCVSVCLCVYVCVCVCVCVCVHDNSKNNDSIHLKLEHIVVYEYSSDEFDIEHCPIKVKLTTLP